MSSNLPVYHGSRLIRVSGFFLAVWVKPLIDMFDRDTLSLDSPWGSRLRDLRFAATFPNSLSVRFDNHQEGNLNLQVEWPRSAIEEFCIIGRQAVTQLRATGTIRRDELRSWRLVDDYEMAGGIGLGTEVIGLEGAAATGEAVLSLLDGTLPDESGPGWWYFPGAEPPRLVPSEWKLQVLEIPRRLESALESRGLVNCTIVTQCTLHLRDGRTCLCNGPLRHHGYYIVIVSSGEWNGSDEVLDVTPGWPSADQRR